MLWFKKKKENETKVVENKPTSVHFKNIGIDDFTLDVSNQDEIDLVSCIVASIMSNDKMQSKFKVKSIKEVDTDKEIAVGLVATLLAQDRPHSHFRCHSITEINK